MSEPDHSSSFISSRSGKIVFILQDDLSLFDEKANSFPIDEASDVKYHLFLDEVFANSIAVNWEISVIKDGQPQTFFFSGHKIDRHTWVKISTNALDSMIFLNEVQPAQSAESSLNADQYPGIKEFEEVTRLNNELLEIQRQLARKNLELEQVNERLEKLAMTDSLTSLFNRRAILNFARTELERGLREGKIFGLAIVDLDQFKEINDQFGHQAGDDTLLALAEILEKNTRDYDCAGRLGGDEFMIFFSVSSLPDLKAIIERIMEEIREIRIPVDENMWVEPRASIGVVHIQGEINSDVVLDDLIRRADRSLYDIKASGGDAYKLTAYE